MMPSWKGLREALARLYQGEADARRVAHDVGLAIERIDWSGSSENRWQAVLTEATRCRLLDKVVAIACKEYPEFEGVRRHDALGVLYSRRDELRIQGRDTYELDEEIKRIVRDRRNGPLLHVDEYLGGDRYRLIQEIGHGGSATVYEAYDRYSQRRVAVKVLNGQWSRDESRTERFDRGARTLQRLRHSNIVRVEQLRQVENGFHYFVMEYVDGGDLYGAVTGGAIKCERAVYIVSCVANALHFAHVNGVIHRDVKPQNILLSQSGEPILTDFDLALLQDSTGGTGTGGIGTFLYAAPEVLENANSADACSDVYSLGMTAESSPHFSRHSTEKISRVT